MKIAVIGAGIIGLSTALALARDGHEVTVYEKNASVAEETSFASGGWLWPSLCVPMAAPDLETPLLVTGNRLLGSSNWRWMRRWRSAKSSSTLRAWSEYSRSLQWQNCADPLESAECRTGALILLRTRQEIDWWEKFLPALEGESAMIVAPEVVHTLEPGLNHKLALKGAVHLPRAQSMNSRLWCQELRQQLSAMDVRVWTGTIVERLISTNSTNTSTNASEVQVHVNQQGQSTVTYDAAVLCTGTHTKLLEATGLDLPTMLIGGYSITAPVRDPFLAPRSSILDWSSQSCITRLGRLRVRISAGAHLGASVDSTTSATPLTPPSSMLKPMYNLLRETFAAGVQLSSAHIQEWQAQRCFLPDGLPALGATAQKGVWLNIGHANSGLALAAGCAQALAHMIAQDFEGLEGLEGLEGFEDLAGLDLRSLAPERFSRDFSRR